MICPKYARERERLFNTIYNLITTPFNYEEFLFSENISVYSALKAFLAFVRTKITPSVLAV
ncbi:hypothetical protein O3M35_012247 [Rhynocoris fuscipes]|uniref:Uncharacterized protein n=1 Tax=Rhynocoris fuscipes TaxID=488301 RepID=A0AAW1CZP2_9HEMI